MSRRGREDWTRRAPSAKDLEYELYKMGEIFDHKTDGKGEHSLEDCHAVVVAKGLAEILFFVRTGFKLFLLLGGLLAGLVVAALLNIL